jgi:hypothetical protein
LVLTAPRNTQNKPKGAYQLVYPTMLKNKSDKEQLVNWLNILKLERF